MNRRGFGGLWACLLSLLSAGCGTDLPAATASEHGSATEPRSGYLYARPRKVFDGDSFTAVSAEGRKLEVRLAEVDAPEKGEPFSDRARSRLRGLIGDRDIAIRLFDVDRYGRIVGRVFVDGTDVNAVLVSEGLAVVYCRYAKDPELFELEAAARDARRGIWSADRIPRREGYGPCPNVPGAAPPAASSASGCGDKRSCRQMESCAEALFYLTQCGLTGMDGDGDGVPCESGVCAASGRQ